MWAVAGAAAGAAPWIGYALVSGPARLIGELGGSAIAGAETVPFLTRIGQHGLNFSLLGLTTVFGFRPPWSVEWLALPLLPFVLFFWLAALISFVRRAVKRAIPAVEWLLIGVGLTLCAAFILTPFGADPSGRYFLPLGVVLALAGANFIERVLQQGDRNARILAIGLVVLVTGYALIGTIQAGWRNPPGITTQFDPITRLDHRYDGELIEFLRSQGETRGYANYWIAYPLAFLSRDELIFTPRLPYHEDLRYTGRDDRYQPYDVAVAEAERAAYIVSRLHPTLAGLLRERFLALNVAWQERTIGDTVVFYRLSRKVTPEEIGFGRTDLDGSRSRGWSR
jgi:hypothetical protein